MLELNRFRRNNQNDYHRRSKKNGFVAIAADTLTTFGNTRLSASMDLSHDKILQCRESFIGVCGSAAHHLVLTNLQAKMPNVQLNSKAEIFETFRKLHPLLKEECFLNPKEDEDDPYESSQITALIVNSSGIYAIYSMREVFEYSQFRAIGSGHEFALGAMQQAYSHFDSAQEIARAGAETGISFDRNSATPITEYSVRLRQENNLQDDRNPSNPAPPSIQAKTSSVKGHLPT